MRIEPAVLPDFRVCRDFKPDNILLPTVDAADANVKLSDFGLAAEAPGLNLCFMCGSPSKRHELSILESCSEAS